MKYLALIYAAADAGPKRGTPEFERMMSDYGAATQAFQAAGVMKGGDALESTEVATSVRVRDGRTETMDGPFAETKERLGGYYVFDCETLDDAIKFAAMIPSAKFGTIELRPIWAM